MNAVGIYFMLIQVLLYAFFFKNSSDYWKNPKTYLGLIGITLSFVLIGYKSLLVEIANLAIILYSMYTSLLQLSRHSYTDPLTRLSNRRYLTNNPIEIGSKVLYIDIDKFKSVNDTYGHSVGDKVLVDVANILKSSTRGSDVCVRVGGDEFILATSKEENVAMAIEERIQRNIDKYNETAVPKISISIGVQTYTGGNFTDFIKKVDSLMYEQKRLRKQNENEKH